jgi:hypothetical protein
MKNKKIYLLIDIMIPWHVHFVLFMRMHVIFNHVEKKMWENLLYDIKY